MNVYSNYTVCFYNDITTLERSYNMSKSLKVVAPQKQETLSKKPEKKKVTFKEPSKKSESFVLSLEHKIIILSTFFFFVFMDTQFKKYILNILVQIFGSFLKSEHGHMTKMGMFVYSLFYGSILLTIVTCIDITSFHLAF